MHNTNFVYTITTHMHNPNFVYTITLHSFLALLPASRLHCSAAALPRLYTAAVLARSLPMI